MKTYRDIVGDGGSNIGEQVAVLRQRINANLASVRHMLAIASGKGGVGKSTLTLQLAAALRAQGWTVAVLDADLNGPSQARLGGLQQVPLIPGRRGLALPQTAEGIGILSMGAVVPETSALEFASVAQGDTHTWRATREFSLLAEILATVEWGSLDCLLFDLPPGAERTFQYAEFLGPQVGFVLVTLPSALARGVVARSAATLAQAPNRVIGYVENMSGYYCPDCETVKPLFPETDSTSLELPCLGSIPFDPRLAAACDQGRPQLPPGSLVQSRLKDLSTRLLSQLEESP